MSRNINKLSILFRTNIPGKADVPFTRQLIYHPDMKDSISPQLSEHPYLVTNQKYNADALNNMKYPDRIAFFFSEDKMLQNIDAFVDGMAENSDIALTNEYIRNNVLAMLSALFPTKYPYVNDIQNSYDILLQNPSKLNSYPSVELFSYIKLDIVYTFQKLIWLNDLLNHPKYRELLVKYNKLDKFVENKKINFLTTEQGIIDEKIRDVVSASDKVIKAIGEIFGTNPSRQSRRQSMLAAILKFILENPELSYQEMIDKYTGSNSTLMQNAIDHNTVSKNLFENIRDSINDDSYADESNVISKIKKYEKVKVLIRQYLFDPLKKPTAALTISTRGKNAVKINTLYDNYSAFVFGEPLKSILKDYDDLNSLFETSLDDNKIRDYAAKFPAYRDFIATLQSFSETRNSSTNALLQKLLNCKTKDTAIAMYKMLHEISGYYLKGNAGTGENVTDLINVGITNTNAREETKPSLEICVYADFLGGELNDDNLKKLKCNLEGERLGNKLLSYSTKKRKEIHPWNVTPDITFMNIDTMQSEDINAVEKKNVETTEPQNEVRNAGKNKQPAASSSDINMWFLSEINQFKSGKFLKKLESLISDMNKTLAEKALRPDTVVEYIQKNNPELYSKFAQQVALQYTPSSGQRDALFQLISEYNGKTKAIQDKIDQYKLADIKTIEKLSREHSMFKMYEFIAEFLLEIEKEKGVNLKSMGGKSAKKNVTQKYRKTIKKMLRKYTRR